MRRSLPALARKHGGRAAALSRRPLAAAERGAAPSRAATVEVRSRAAMLGVRLTADEALLLQNKTNRLLPRRLRTASRQALTRDEFLVCRRRFLAFARKRLDTDLEREAMLATIEQPTEATRETRQLLPLIGVVGTVSWSIAGTQAAGEAGMHIIGCALVGCISSMGGGTVNNLLFGDAKHGVNWVKNPRSTLMVALAASVVTFYAWPEICYVLSERHLERIHEIAEENSWYAWSRRRFGLGYDTDKIAKEQFLRACRSEKFLKEFQGVFVGGGAMSAEQIFEALDKNGDEELSLDELARWVKLRYDGSWMRYMLDTVSVAASAVTGTAGAISRGLHPVVCVASSVTLCFGGMTRDLLCRRDVALCSQSFALCSAAGAAVYVALREANLRGATLPLGLRILATAGVTVALRIVSFLREEPLLRPMMSDA